MTYEQVCKFFEDRGYKSFKHDNRNHSDLMFINRDKSLEGPDCNCNDKPAPFHVYVCKPMDYSNSSFSGSIRFASFGECNEIWTEFEIYSISFEELNDKIVEKAHKALSTMWVSFYESISEQKQKTSDRLIETLTLKLEEAEGNLETLGANALERIRQLHIMLDKERSIKRNKEKTQQKA